MFDYIKCEVPLPDGWEAEELQTKDIEQVCWMATHIITKEGRLMIDEGHNETVPLMERPKWKPEWGDSIEAQREHGLEALIGCMRWVSNYKDANYHGYLRFYGHETIKVDDDDDNPVLRWHEYRAKFTDGHLVEITQVNIDG